MLPFFISLVAATKHPSGAGRSCAKKPSVHVQLRLAGHDVHGIVPLKKRTGSARLPSHAGIEVLG
jgi:hypothetical protein